MKPTNFRQFGPPSCTQSSPLRQAVLLMLAVSAIAPAGLLAQTDDFNDGDDAGWFHYDPIASQISVPQNSWSFPSGKYRLQAAPTPVPAAGPGRVGSFRQDVSYSNFHLEVDLLDWDPTRTNAFGLAARIQPDPAFGTLSGYIFGYVTGDNYLALVRLDRERTRTIPNSLPFPIALTPGHGYRLAFTGKGAELAGRLYDLADPGRPLAELLATEASFVEGTAGLIGFGVNAGALSPVDVTFDNYAAADRDRPWLKVEFSPFTFNELLVRWPQFEGEGYTLQSANSLGSTAVWTDLPDVFVEGENLVHNAGTPPGNLFFRLRKSPSP